MVEDRGVALHRRGVVGCVYVVVLYCRRDVGYGSGH